MKTAPKQTRSNNHSSKHHTKQHTHVSEGNDSSHVKTWICAPATNRDLCFSSAYVKVKQFKQGCVHAWSPLRGSLFAALWLRACCSRQPRDCWITRSSSQCFCRMNVYCLSHVFLSWSRLALWCRPHCFPAVSHHVQFLCASWCITTHYTCTSHVPRKRMQATDTVHTLVCGSGAWLLPDSRQVAILSFNLLNCIGRISTDICWTITPWIKVSHMDGDGKNCTDIEFKVPTFGPRNRMTSPLRWTLQEREPDEWTTDPGPPLNFTVCLR